MAVQVIINGDNQLLELIPGQSTVHDLVSLLDLKADQVAIEQNGSIVRRAEWSSHSVQPGDRFEIVQFVGGGCATVIARRGS